MWRVPNKQTNERKKNIPTRTSSLMMLEIAAERQNVLLKNFIQMIIIKR